MPKTKLSNNEKANKFASQQPNEFCVNSKGELWCKLCSVSVTCTSSYYVESHKKSSKHQDRLMLKPKQPKLFCQEEKHNVPFSMRVSEAFLGANIPLKKLQSKPLRKLFEFMGHPLPSESSCRNNIDKLYDSMVEKITNIIEDKKIFLVFDESAFGEKFFANILIGTLDEPTKTYLIDALPVQNSLNSNAVCQIVDSVMKRFNIERNNFCLFLTDAAPYMVRSGKDLKIFYPNMFNVTCTAHLLHNCCLRIRSNFQNVDFLISSVKAATVKNRTRRSKFAHIGTPPQPVLTRWGSWLKAASYYAANLVELRNIFQSINEDGILMENVKRALQNETLAADICTIESQYASIPDLITMFESSSFTIAEAFHNLKSIDLGQDCLLIKDYISKRLNLNEISLIIGMKNDQVSPATYSLLQKCQPTTCTVERSFSILGKLLEKDRNFKLENVKKYLMLQVNSFMNE